MRRFPVRGLSVLVLAVCLTALPTLAAQAAPWSVSPLEGGWFAKVELLVARVLGRWSAGAADTPVAAPGPSDSRTKDGALIDPNGQT